VDARISAFHADVDSSPPPTSDAVRQDDIITQLANLTAQMKAIADSVAAVTASFGPLRLNDLWKPIVRFYCDNRGHAEMDCFKRQQDEKRKVKAFAST
jgi:hypothetical protein